MPIPKIVHRTWLSPDDENQPIPSDILDNIRLWEKDLHGFIEYTWTNDSLSKLILSMSTDKFKGSELVELYNVCRMPAMKADLARLCLLYEFGGFWVDLKLIPKGIEMMKLCNFQLVLLEHQASPEVPDPSVFRALNNCFLGCIPGSQFALQSLVLAADNIANRCNATPWDVTGPRVIMNIADRFYGNVFELSDPDVCLIRQFEFFDKIVGYGSSSYNDNGMHWSIRCQSESIYNE